MCNSVLFSVIPRSSSVPRPRIWQILSLIAVLPLLFASLPQSAEANPSNSVSTFTLESMSSEVIAQSDGEEHTLSSPRGMALDQSGNLYIADSENHRVYMVPKNGGQLTVFAGTGEAGYDGDGGPPTQAQLNSPTDVSVDYDGAVYIADTKNNVIRKVSGDEISTVAGTGSAGYNGDEGSATSIQLRRPYGVAAHNGDTFIADTFNHCVRRVDLNGDISTFAGQCGENGFSGDGSSAASARLSYPMDIAVNAPATISENSLIYGPYEHIFIADYGNNRVRRVGHDYNNTIGTFAGNGESGFGDDGGSALDIPLNNPIGIAYSGTNNLYIAEQGNHRIRKVANNSSRIISTIAGTGEAGYDGDDEAAVDALLNGPNGVVVDVSGNVFIADTYNDAIRMVGHADGLIVTVVGNSPPVNPTEPSGIITTVAGNGVAGYSGDDGPAIAANLWRPIGVMVDDQGNFYIADDGNRIRKVNSSGIITTVAGNGSGGDNSPAENAYVNRPSGVTKDIFGNIYIAEPYSHRIRKIAPNGIITTVVGTGTAGHSGDGGLAIEAQLNHPTRLYVHSDGGDLLGDSPHIELYIADSLNHRIRKVGSNGIITTVAGNGVAGSGGDGGLAINASINRPYGMTVDRAGNIYIAEADGHRVRKVTIDGIISTIVGTGISGYSGDGGSAIAATLSTPAGVSIDGAGNVYIADQNNHRIRKVSTDGIIATAAGTGTGGFTGDGGPATNARIYYPQGLSVDFEGNIYVADKLNYRIRKVTPVNGNAATPTPNPILSPAANNNGWNNTDVNVTWNWSDENDDIDPNSCSPTSVSAGEGLIELSATCTDLAGNVGVANQIIRVDKSEPDTTILIHPSDVSRSNYALFEFEGIDTISGIEGFECQLDGGSFVPCNNSHSYTNLTEGEHTISVRAKDVAGNLDSTSASYTWIVNTTDSSLIITVAGDGSAEFDGDGGPATSASLSNPTDTAVDGNGNFYIADADNHRIRMVDSIGNISTVAGNGSSSFSGDGGAATNASLRSPYDVAVDGAGNLYIADRSNHRIRKINTSDTILTLAGNGLQAFDGDGGVAINASLFNPNRVALDDVGNLYIADTYNHRIRKIDTSGNISTVAGNGTASYSGDGGLATTASLYYPQGIAVDRAGNLYIGDTWNHRIRKVDSSGIISTIAGDGTAGYGGDDGPATSASLHRPYGVAVDRAGSLYIADRRNHRIRKVETGGIIITVAGNGTAGFSGDGGQATGASLTNPTGVVVDEEGNLYIADSGNHRIRKVISGQANVGEPPTPTAVIDGEKHSYPASTIRVTSQLINSGDDNLSDSKLTYWISSSAKGEPLDPNLTMTRAVGTVQAGMTSDSRLADIQIPRGIAPGNYHAVVEASGYNSDNLLLTTAPVDRVSVSFDVLPCSGQHFCDVPELSPFTAVPYTFYPEINAIHQAGYMDDCGMGGAEGADLTFCPKAYLERADIGIILLRRHHNNVNYTPDPTREYQGYFIDVPESHPRWRIIEELWELGITVGCEGSNPGQDLKFCPDYDTSGVDGFVNRNTMARFIARTEGWDLSFPADEDIFKMDVKGDGDWQRAVTYMWYWGITNGSPTCQNSPSSNNPKILTYCPDDYVFRGMAAGFLARAFGLVDDLIQRRCGTLNVSIDPADIGTVVPNIAPNCPCIDDQYKHDREIVLTATPNGPYVEFVEWVGDVAGVEPSISITLTKAETNITANFLDNPPVNTPPTVDAGPDQTITLPDEVQLSGSVDDDELPGGQPTARWTHIEGEGTVTFADENSAVTTATFSQPGVYVLRLTADDGELTASSDITITVSDSETGTSPIITTLAGNGFADYSGDGGPATNAGLQPFSVAVDSNGNVYFADKLNHRVRKIDTNGIVTTIAGTGVAGYSGDGGNAITAQLQHPYDLALDTSGNLYIADQFNHRIRMINTAGIINTVVGNGSGGFSGDNGPATSAMLLYPSGITVDHIGNLYVTDKNNYRIRKVDLNGIITTVAGNGSSGYSGDGGLAINAQLQRPFRVAVDCNSTIFISDKNNYRIRKVDSDGIITTITPSQRPLSVVLDIQGNLYVAEYEGHIISKIDMDANVTRFAGNGTAGYSGDGGPAVDAQLRNPYGVAIDKYGAFYIADTGNNRIRKIAPFVASMTPPIACPTQSPLPNNNGWNNTDVTVTWNWADANNDIDSNNCELSTVSIGEGSINLTAACNDLAGNQGTANYSVQIDKTEPETQIDASPPISSTTPTATFEFSGSDALSGITKYECQLDGGGFTDCTSPAEYTDLAAGDHTFEVRAVDLAANADSTPATYTWTVRESRSSDMDESLDRFTYDADDTSHGATFGTLSIYFNFVYNNESGAPLENVFFEVTTATNSFLRNPDDGTPGFVGFRLPIPNADLPGDNFLFEDGEILTVPFVVGISGVPWTLHFDMFADDASGVQAASRVPVATFTIDSSMIDLSNTLQLEPMLFLPFFSR
ncbi:MAG: hypothetical protein AAF702_02465 [Chloroflexota bacterium]